jgi:hypothetical protein
MDTQGRVSPSFTIARRGIISNICDFRLQTYYNKYSCIILYSELVVLSTGVLLVSSPSTSESWTGQVLYSMPHEHMLVVSKALLS